MIKKILAAVGIFSLILAAESEENICKFLNCVPSKSVTIHNRPDSIATYNDLTRSKGGFIDEYLNRIMLRGKLVDTDCLPVANAHISIWQKDGYGIDRYLEYLSIPEKLYKNNNDSYSEFSGTGSAFSDNEGRFIFITVYPGKESIKPRNDYINLIVKANALKEFSGEVSLDELVNPNHKEKNSTISAEFNKEASDFYGIDVYDFSVVMDGHSNKYRY
jgi:protocatechuate 3,4-dioxygenase, beta subunit